MTVLAVPISLAPEDTETYSYDEMGNIAQLSHGHRLADGTIQIRNRNFIPFIDSEFVPINNRLETVSIGSLDYAYRYNSNGNMVQENVSRHFEWDHSDRLKVFRIQPGSAEPSVHAHYLYDANGQRVKKLVRRQSGQVDVTVYVDGMFEYHRQVRGTTVLENNTLHVMDDQQRIALVLVGTAFSGDRSPAVRYHLGDHLGSSNVVVDSDGSLINREEFTPYGKTSFGSFAKKRYRFTGKERDEESGLNYHGARYYAPWLGKWCSPDPIGIASGVNLYVYVSGDPNNLWDPDGRQERATQQSVDVIFYTTEDTSDPPLAESESPQRQTDSSRSPLNSSQVFELHARSIARRTRDRETIIIGARDTRDALRQLEEQLGDRKIRDVYFIGHSGVRENEVSDEFQESQEIPTVIPRSAVFAFRVAVNDSGEAIPVRNGQLRTPYPHRPGGETRNRPSSQLFQFIKSRFDSQRESSIYFLSCSCGRDPEFGQAISDFLSSSERRVTVYGYSGNYRFDFYYTNRRRWVRGLHETLTGEVVRPRGRREFANPEIMGQQLRREQPNISR